MGTTFVVSGLVAKRAEMAGRIEHHRREVARLGGELAHLDATLRLFAPEIDMRTLRVSAYREHNRYFKQGERQRLVLEIFRQADGIALSSRQIGEALIERKQLASTPPLIEQMQKAAIAVVRRLERAGIVRAWGHARQGMTWTLV